MILSVHAKERMLKKGISEEEVRECIEHSSLEFRDFVKEEIRIGKKLEFNDKTIIVVYTVQQEQERIITIYRLRRKKMVSKDGYYCGKCDVELKPAILANYEYEEDIPLHNVSALKCPKCDNVVFTEEQADELESRTEELKKRTFGFPRKVTISGKSLVVGIPSELAEHLHIKKGQKVRILPSRNGFLVQKA